MGGPEVGDEAGVDWHAVQPHLRARGRILVKSRPESGQKGANGSGRSKTRRTRVKAFADPGRAGEDPPDMPSHYRPGYHKRAGPATAAKAAGECSAS